MFRERVLPTVTWFVAALLFIPAVILALAPINLGLGIVMSIVVYAGVVAFFIAKSPIVEVTATELRAGKGRIEREFLGQATAIPADETFAALHTELDARAWLCLRHWVRGLVRIELTDPNDPTPYWLVSTRRPEQLARALNTPSA